MTGTVIIIPSYDGDGVERIGALNRYEKSQAGDPYVILKIGHEGHATKPIYRAYKLAKCDRGVFHIDPNGKTVVGIPV